MPGKAQRTKGNLKPSSSSQAVQLLAQSGHSAVGFIGFSNQPAYVPASEIFDDVDSTLDADFRLVLRKFSKKDTVTKIKALHEFISLCGSKNDDTIKAVLPFWPRIYNKVAIDVDHKVRELSQKALLALADKVGKHLSPHLRSIMGAWMVSMCDTYPTVASAANGAFSSVFPPAKQTAAIQFCKIECSEYFLNNITKQTPQTMSDPLTTSEEDMKGKYHRVVCSSFHALRKLVTALKDSSEVDFLTSSLTTLLESPNFWKHAKSSVSVVNGGFLSILSCICQLRPAVSGGFVHKISPLVFSFLDSRDTIIVSYCWEALLSLINAHSECWQHVNWQKAVWPKLKNVLESGCGGHAEVIGPCLLPLLSKLPERPFTTIFDAFRLGLNQESVLNSPSAMSALVKAFGECVQFCVKISIDGKDSDCQTVIQGLIQDQVLIVVEASLTDTKMSLARSPLYSLVSSLVIFQDDYASIEKEFWKELSTFARHQLLSGMDAPNAESTSGEDGMVQSSVPSLPMNSFFSRLWHLVKGIVFQESYSRNLKKQKVKFQQEETPTNNSISKKEKKTLTESCEHFISDILVSSFYLATEYKAVEYFKLFKDIASLHVPKEVAKRLNNEEDSLKLELCEEIGTRLKKRNVERDLGVEKKLRDMCGLVQSNSDDEFVDFLYMSLLKFLLYEQQLSEPNLKFTEEIIVSSFAFLQHLPEDAAIKFLSFGSEVLASLPIVCQFMENLIGHVTTIPVCAKALEMSDISSKITEIASGVAGGGSRDETESGGIWSLLLSFVSQFEEGPFVFNPCLDAIIKSCVLTMNHYQQRTIELAVHPFMDFVTVVHSILQKRLVKGHPKFRELMSSLLILNLGTTTAFNDKCVDKVEEALAAGFQLVVSDLPAEIFLLDEMCRIIRNWASSRLKSVDNLQPVMRTVEILVSSVRSCECEDSEESVSHQSNETGKNSNVEVNSDASEDMLDNVLCTDHVRVDELIKITHQLYLEGVLFTSDHNFHSRTASLSLESYALLVLYNLRMVKTVHRPHTSQTDSKHDLQPTLTTKKLRCLIQATDLVFLLNAGHKLKSEVSEDTVLSLAEEIQSETMNLVSSMTKKQIQALVDLVLQSSNNATATFAVGMETFLEYVLHSGTNCHSKRAVIDGLQPLQTSFIHRCIGDKAEADTVAAILKGKTIWSKSDLAQAYGCACSRLMALDDVKLSKVSECIFGFIRLCSQDKTSSNENVSFFNKTFEMANWLKEKGIHLLTGSDSEESDNTELLQYNVCVVRALRSAPVYRKEEYWDFTLCTLVELIQFVSESDITAHSSLELQTLMASVCDLAAFAARTFATLPIIESSSAETDPSKMAVQRKTKTEWEEFFSEGVYSPFLTKFVMLATESLRVRRSSPAWNSLLERLASAVSLCPTVLLLSHEFPARLTVTDKSSIPDGIKSLLNHFCPLLNASLWKTQISAFSLLRGVMIDVSIHEAKCAEGAKGDREEDEARSPPEALSLVVEAAAVSLDSLLMTEDIEDDAGMAVSSQEHTLALSYLLAWSLQLQLFKCASNELRAKYAQFFKNHESVSHLCDHLFRLMPSHPSSSVLEFKLALDGTDEMSSYLLGGLAIYVYRQCLEVLPALVRTWWVEQNRKISNFADKFTTQNISNSLCVQQLTSSEMTTTSIEDLTIRPRPAAREVSAVYEMAEVTVNMTIKLPENYPLGKVEVSCDKRVGVSQAQWDKWLLQLNIFLQHQNGSIVEGLKLWKGNIDKKFEGIDDCMVCFSVIHGTTFQLPRLTCRTCRKKFHSSCLYKWFNTSQKSSCPLCRNLF